MPKDIHISIIQLIKESEISIDYEISNIRANKDVNLHIYTYLKKSNYFNELQDKISEVQAELADAKTLNDELFFSQKLQNLLKVEKDFIVNTLYLAHTLSRIEPRSNKIKKAIELFEQAKIDEADSWLDEADLLNDQYNLIVFIEYQERKLKFIEDELK